MKFSFALTPILFLPALVNAQFNDTSTPRDTQTTIAAGPTQSVVPAPASPGNTTPANPTFSAGPSNIGTTALAGSISSAGQSSVGMTIPASSTSSVSAGPTSTVTGGSAASTQSSGPIPAPSSVGATIPPSQPTGQGTTGGGGATTPTNPTFSAAAVSTNNGGTRPSSATSPAAQPSCPPTDTCVQVGPDGQLNYNPSNFAASNGTVVTFLFPPESTSNSVTQCSFEDPCVYLTATGGNPGGFDSGLQNGKLFSIKITNDQLPIYYFSKEQKFCGQGMVGAINPPTTGDTYNAYLAAAKALGPNQKIVPDNGPVLSGVGAQAVGTPSPIPSTPATSSSSHMVANGFFALLAAAFGVTLT